MSDPQDNPRQKFTNLRQRAEERLKVEAVVISPGELSPPEAARLIHQLRVHQIELEMQNEELRQAQARLEESRHRYADLYDFAPLGYLTLDEKGVTLEANLTACSFLGMERSRLLGFQFALLLAKPDRSRFRNLLVNSLKLPELQEEFLIQASGGKLCPILLNVFFLRDTAGLEIRRLILTDITALKSAQEALKESQEKVLRLNEALEQRVKERTAELEMANQELESFSFSVSHDLKTPLRAIQGFSRILMEKHTSGLDQEGRRLLQVVVNNTQLMHRLIEDLLNLARLASQPLNKTDVDLVGLARGLFTRLKSQDPEGDLQLIAPDAPLASGDYYLLQQVMQNLLENAVKFTRGKDQAIIEVGGYSKGSEIVYYVKDNGVGFDEEYAHKLFLVFQRLHPCAEYAGHGVGLAIVQRIIQRHGGRVWAEGKVGEGATFYFSLPNPTRKKK